MSRFIGQEWEKAIREARAAGDAFGGSHRAFAHRRPGRDALASGRPRRAIGLGLLLVATARCRRGLT